MKSSDINIALCYVGTIRNNPHILSAHVVMSHPRPLIWHNLWLRQSHIGLDLAENYRWGERIARMIHQTRKDIIWDSSGSIICTKYEKPSVSDNTWPTERPTEIWMGWTHWFIWFISVMALCRLSHWQMRWSRVSGTCVMYNWIMITIRIALENWIVKKRHPTSDKEQSVFAFMQ